MNTEFEQSRKQLEELVGSKVELIITSGLYKGSYPSRLEELDNGLLGVAHPMVRGALLPALRSTELLMKVETSSGFYQATVLALRSTVNVTFPLLWLKLLTVMEKVQRRMFVRVPSAIKVNICFLGCDAELPEGTLLPPREWILARVSDISLGGAGILLKDNFSEFCVEGGRYILQMTVSSGTFFLIAKMVKILKKNQGSLEVGVAYEGLAAFTEKVLGGYIRQQELMTRG
ncbi:MAG: flagellar brake domain-containing protein [Synergistaceae bacterium]|jgi:c-di-GMP-binding flagellar brake protein YcgR|nr:flagellar brake domain-containing protein [Synergistaceae bacterium]